MCKPPYARTERMTSTIGLVRFQTSQSPSFCNAREENWDSIYSRSLVVKMKSAFIRAMEYDAPQFEMKEGTGVFPKDGDLGKFLESRQAAGAFVRVIYSFMNMYTIDDCRQMIDDYARHEGTTWAVMRAACGLIEVVDLPKFEGGIIEERLRYARGYAD